MPLTSFNLLYNGISSLQGLPPDITTGHSEHLSANFLSNNIPLTYSNFEIYQFGIPDSMGCTVLGYVPTEISTIIEEDTGAYVKRYRVLSKKGWFNTTTSNIVKK